MTTTLLRAGTLACALMTSTCLTAPALAQSTPQPSVYQHVDDYGVDLTDGSFNFSLVEGSIGSGEGAIELVRSHGVGGPSDNLTAGFKRTQTGSNVVISLTFGNRREDFSGAASATSFTNEQGGGATLTKVSVSEYVYRAADGTATTYEMPAGLSDAPNNAYCSTNNQSLCVLVPTSTVRPNGSSVSYVWDVGENCGGGLGHCAQFWRLRGIDNSFGYRVRFTFVTETNPSSGLPGADWHRRDTAALSNTAVSGSATRTVDYNYLSSTETEIITDGDGVWRLTGTSAGLSAVRAPGSTSDDISVTYASGTSVVSQVTAGGVAASYSRSVSGSTATMVRTDALSNTLTVVSDLNVGRPTSVTDEAGRTTAYDYDADGRLESVTAPEGNAVSYAYDARGNVTGVTRSAKPGSGLDPMVTSATYPSSCANQVTCNLPETTTDERGYVTDYTYNSTHGGVLTVTAPAPGGGIATRPQTRYSYTLTNGETLLTGISACASGDATSGCLDTANESRGVIGYDANGNVTSLQRRDGTGALSATSAMTWDAHGNLLTVDGPLSGTADTVRFRYDPARRRVGAVGPDPDGTGLLVHRATKTTYDSRGLATVVATGTVNSQSDSDWTAFTSLARTEQVYDANRRPAETRLLSGTTAYALTQTSYDALGRPDCVAQRMNPAEFASPPSSACTLDTEGSFGPDRIVRRSYDAAGRVLRVESAVGTSDEADEVATTYTANGQVEILTDAEGNRTTYVYDGHDRLSRTRFPCAATVSPCTLGASSTTDYEELTYVTATVSGVSRSTPLAASFRTRGNATLDYTYDALGRLTVKTVPERSGLDTAHTRDVYYGYDLLGALTFARFDSATGTGVTNSYDALGRLASTTTDMDGTARTLSYHYDAASNRTRITHPDGNWFGTLYDVASRPYYLDANGAGGIAYASYYSHGGLSTLQRLGAASGFAWDAVLRPSSRSHYFAGTTGNGGWSYGYNPAGQLSLIQRDDPYAESTANTNVAYSANGLNQHVTVGGATHTHDANGNLASDGTRNFAYDVENRLVSATGTPTSALKYDPLGRLFEVDSVNGTTRFLYDGHTLVGEYGSNGTLLRRHIHWPGVDVPTATYEGADLSTIRQLFSNHLGSVVAIADGNGANIAINRYDEYGVPQGGNVTGRFGYTGQMWLPEVGMYYYRARIYDPNGGRFPQFDPSGYADGMNGYNYAGGDPVNVTDPFGLDGCTGSRIAASCANNNSQGGVPSWSPGYSSEGWNGDFRFPKPASDGGGGGAPGGGGVATAASSLGSYPGGGGVATAASRVGSVSFGHGSAGISGTDDCGSSNPANCHIMVMGGTLSSRNVQGGLLHQAAYEGPSRRRRDFCGGGGQTWPPERVFGTDISGACAKHDYCYSSFSSTDRLTCDRQLRRDIWFECGRQSRLIGCYISGQVYFMSVRSMGEGFYEGTGNPD